MKYLLDTNICIHFLRGAYGLDAKIRAAGLENCFVSEITLAELEYGIENSPTQYQEKQRESLQKFVDTFEPRVVPVRSCFSIYAQNRAHLRKKGTPISDFDLLIGCSAIANQLTMVTENVAEFSRIEGLRLENWVARNEHPLH